MALVIGNIVMPASFLISGTGGSAAIGSGTFNAPPLLGTMQSSVIVLWNNGQQVTLTAPQAVRLVTPAVGGSVLNEIIGKQVKSVSATIPCGPAFLGTAIQVFGLEWNDTGGDGLQEDFVVIKTLDDLYYLQLASNVSLV